MCRLHQHQGEVLAAVRAIEQGAPSSSWAGAQAREVAAAISQLERLAMLEDCCDDDISDSNSDSDGVPPLRGDECSEEEENQGPAGPAGVHNQVITTGAEDTSLESTNTGELPW